MVGATDEAADDFAVVVCDRASKVIDVDSAKLRDVKGPKTLGGVFHSFYGPTITAGVSVTAYGKITGAHFVVRVSSSVAHEGVSAFPDIVSWTEVCRPIYASTNLLLGNTTWLSPTNKEVSEKGVNCFVVFD